MVLIAPTECMSVIKMFFFPSGYMKFFGCIAHCYPKETFEKHSVVFDTLFEIIQSGDRTILPVALDTLGFIGTTVEGKLCLAALGMCGCMYNLQVFLRLSQPLPTSTQLPTPQ